MKLRRRALVDSIESLFKRRSSEFRVRNTLERNLRERQLKAVRTRNASERERERERVGERGAMNYERNARAAISRVEKFIS